MFEAAHRRDPAVGGRGSGRRHPRRPPRRPVGPRRAYARRPPRGDRAGALAGGGEDPRSSVRRCPPSWPVDGTSGYEALREIQGDVRRPRRRGPAQRSSPPSTPASGESLHAAEHERPPLEIADTILVGRGAPHRRDSSPCRSRAMPPRSSAPATPSRSCCAGSPSTGRTCPKGQEAPWTPRCRSRAPTGPTSPTSSTPIRSAMLADPRGELATRVQQTSGMVMAKGVEDTTFYRWNRFVALNEVGGATRPGSVSPPVSSTAELAGREASLAHHDDHAVHPRHQTFGGRPRPARGAGGDARRVGAACVRRWSDAPPAARPLPRAAGLAEPGRRVADLAVERMAGYLGKASKEAKLVTSHVDAGGGGGRGRGRVARRGARRRGTGGRDRGTGRPAHQPTRAASNSLGQKLLQLAGPGVPDVYQGTELFEYSLVDPDNRRPVDWAARRAILARLDDGWRPDVDAEGAAKLLVTLSGLRLRRNRPELFTGYRPVPAEGPGGGPRGGVLTLTVAGRGRDAAARRAGGTGRLGRHRAPPARCRNRLARHRHRHPGRRLGARAGHAPRAVPGGAAGQARVAEVGDRHRMSPRRLDPSIG